MALPGHSPPPPYNGPGSPVRTMNGYPEPQSSFSMYGPQPRPMLPPSPQHYPIRYPPGPPPPPIAVTNNHNDNRPPIPPQKRPGSSMSISSMLGAEPERPPQDLYSVPQSRNPVRPPSVPGSSMSLGAVMSPPQYPSKPNLGEYAYKPRSQTPDRLHANIQGPRQHRSSSGSMMQRPPPFYDQPQKPPSKPPAPRYGDPVQPNSFNSGFSPKEDREERVRRSSLSGILQRPGSQPEAPTTNGYMGQNVHPIGRPESAAPMLQNGDRYGSKDPLIEAGRPFGNPGAYDTRPPAITNIQRPLFQPIQREIQDHPDTQMSRSISPDVKRQQSNGFESRGLAGILNHNPEPVPTSSNMARQDSVQSQGDRSVFGERYRARPFSPFAPSVASQNPSTTSMNLEEQGRKGSDELSQHRVILGLAAESKRGRYSPLPQAVQGAQAQTPVPDSGIKSEHGRVFAGLGTGMGTSSAAPTPAPGAIPPSPFKHSDGTTRLSEENLMKMSRSTSGISKRSRKLLDDDNKAESEAGDGRKTTSGRGKRSKYANSYKVEPEDLTQRRGTPSASSNPTRTTNNPANLIASLVQSQPLQRQNSNVDYAPVFKPKKTIRIASLITNMKRLPRRHLGSFVYDPDVSNEAGSKVGPDKFDVCIRPNLLPHFSASDQINCTYAVRVPKLWLQKRERGLICKAANLWGSGIYTDDSDVVAAAMHSGFIKAVAPESVDQTLLDRVIQEQNAKIEGLIGVPDQPVDPEEGRDAIITLVVLPSLEKYASSARFGIHSRDWPEDGTKTPHDGVSFTIIKVEYVAGAFEARRMGRTGLQKRARIKKELEDRKRTEAIQKKLIEAATKRLREKSKPKKINMGATSRLAQVMNVNDTIDQDAAVLPLNVGQAPGDWLRQEEGIALA